jgi:chemotaxis protein methyltransferase WspC
LKRFEQLLNREIGLSTRSIGEAAVQAAVKARLRACGVTDMTDYLARLERDAAERKALVEEIVVSETWFFRDEEVFRALQRYATPWLRRDKPLRILSLPCATGEEPYSVSISLLEAGFQPSRFGVHGVDVSDRALGAAKRAVYGKISFRGVEPRLQRNYFEPSDEGWRLLEPARGPVTFARGNVLDTALCGPRSFDVILCRNLLIYLDAQARGRALDNLHGWLADEGLLFGGHAEAIELMDSRFQRLADASPFAYVKQNRARSETKTVQKREPRPANPGASAALRAKPTAKSPSPEPKPAPGSLERATELANRGQLDQARALCERVISEQGASAEAYCLLGIIRSAEGTLDEAIRCFNKSLYLKQDHYQALVHLALLHQQRGEDVPAANFRRRAERARAGQGQ